LVSFDDSDRPLCAPALTRSGAELLKVQTVSRLLLTDAHYAELVQQRTNAEKRQDHRTFYYPKPVG
jgi:hypothetical protein